MSPNNQLNIEFEEAIRLLVNCFPVADKNSRKPVLFHDLRVSVYLYNHNYCRDIILAGLLHDTLEFSNITEEILKEKFGSHVAKIVKANSKDNSIKDSDSRIDELVKRCAAVGQEALIVKAADTLDSFKHYSKTNNQDEIKYCLKNANAIFKYKPADFKDKIFNELKNFQNKFSDES